MGSYTNCPCDAATNAFLDYNAFANALREIDKRPDVVVTVWQGRFNTRVNQPLIPAVQLPESGSAREFVFQALS